MLAPLPATDANAGIVRSVTIVGTERLEPETVRSYLNLSIGDRYDRDRLDQALKALFASELFADATIRDDNGALTVEVKENPVINRIIIEGAKRIKEDKIREEIRLAPRQIFTRSKARADVGRILELYRRGGRFAASVEPKIIQLEQNRVDVVFEIYEGPKSKVLQINILGNEKFKTGKIKKQFATKEARWYGIFSSNDTYDPDRLAYDQQKLRQFYLTEGYADFRVASAIAELTPDNQNFIVTYVLDEGERYKFGTVDLESQIRDIKSDEFKSIIRIQPGDWYNAQKIENTVDQLQSTAGLLGYAFAEVRPQFDRDKEKLEMNVTLPDRGGAARLCRTRADQRQHADPRYRDPPRVPAGRRRCVQLHQDQAHQGPPDRPRLFPGPVEHRPDPGFGARQGHSRNQCAGAADRRSCSCRRASPALNSSSSRCRCDRPTSAAAARNCAPRRTFPAIRTRSTWALPSPISSAATSRWVSTCSAAISARSA